jgi:hypothetical protein
MAVPKQATVNGAPHGPETPARRRGSFFYIGVAIFIMLLSMAGFSPSIADQPGRNGPPSLLVIAHGLTVSAWLLLFLTQAILVRTGRTDVHRRFGVVGLALASLMIVFGYVALMDFGRRGYDFSGDMMRAISRNQPARLNPAVVLFPLGELVSFGVLVGIGLWHRNRPEIHKRLMLFALVPISAEPVLHMVGHLSVRWPALRGIGARMGVAATLLLLCVSAIHDRWTRGRIHPVSFWVPVLLFLWQIVLGVIIFPSAAWRKIVAWLIA